LAGQNQRPSFPLEYLLYYFPTHLSLFCLRQPSSGNPFVLFPALGRITAYLPQPSFFSTYFLSGNLVAKLPLFHVFSQKNQLLSRLLVIFSLVFTILLTVALFNIINLSS
jgi:hypothetical protein